MRILFSLLMTIVLWSPSLGYAYDDQPKCFKELSLNFFTFEAVGQALEIHDVDPSQFMPIYQKLQARSRDVPRIIRDRAQSLGLNNPLEYPFQAEAADKLQQQVLFQIFGEVLYESNVTNESHVRDMFAYIRRKHTAALKACFGKEKS